MINHLHLNKLIVFIILACMNSHNIIGYFYKIHLLKIDLFLIVKYLLL